MPAAKLLSSPGIFLNNERVEVPKGKTSALLYYLAYQHDWVSREDILYLFWPDTEELKARLNLRQLLSSSRKLPCAKNLETNKQSVRWRVPSDTQVFKEAVENKQWAKAVEAYHGPLLDKFRVHRLPEFENWLELERQDLLRIFKGAASQLSQDFMSSERYKEAAEVLSQALEQDPFDEITVRAYLKALFLSEGQDKAKQELASYRESLARDLGAEPEAATLKLLEELKTLAQDSELGVQAVAVNVKNLVTKPLHNLPFKLTPFVGRAKEKAELASYLANPSCRLVTLLGAGGMGKTRLALAVAEEHIGSFEHGVWFVAFDALENPGMMLYQIAEALNFKFYGQDEPKEQLLNYLSNKDMLLILDNLEHLLAGVLLITELLENVPKLKVLATSREVLNLQAEHVFEVRGLAQNPQEENETTDAERLFIQSAQQRRKDLELSEDNLTAISEICDLVEGMPLAIELAASWLSVLTPRAIAQELEQGLSILEGQTRDTPERHQSIKSVFDYSWDLLSKREQTILAKLAVFRGGFTRDAAKQVTGATLPILASLVNKSFLRVLPNGRYDRHPLVFEFCLQKLAERNDIQSVHERHAEYYFELAGEVGIKLRGREQAQWFERIEEEHDNFLAVLDWTLDQERIKMGLQLAIEMAWFWHVRGYYHIGGSWLKRFLSLTSPEEHLNLKIRAHFFMARFFTSLGNYDEAKKLNEVSLTLARELSDQQGIADSLISIAGIYYSQGNYIEAKKISEECKAIYQKLGAKRGLALSLRRLGHIAHNQGNFAEAQKLLEESLTLCQEFGDPRGIADSLSYLGLIADYRSSWAEARKYFERGLLLYREVGDHIGVATVIGGLGSVARYQGEHNKAVQLFEASLEIRRELRDRRGVAISLFNLGNVALNQNHADEAKKLLEESLKLFYELGDQAGMAFVLANFSVMFYKANFLELSVKLFSACQTLCDCVGLLLHPRIKSEMQESLKSIQNILGEERFSVLWVEGEHLSMDNTVELALSSS